MDEVEKRAQIQKEQWLALSEEDKRKFREMEGVVTGISQVREMSQMADRAKNFNPMAILDASSFIASGTQYWIDKVFEHTGQEVPHYVQQEMRSLLYTNEGNGKKLMSMLAYNPDALLSMAVSMKPAGIQVKGIEKLVDVASKVTDKAFKIETKIGFVPGVMKIVPNAVKGLSESIISGAATDPIIDNLMVEAPTASIEELNNITNLFFDAGTFSLGK